MQKLSRRSALAVFGAAGAALSTHAHASALRPAKWDSTVDVVVIGAGVAGLFAAVAAAERGVKNIFVLEQAATPFMNSSSLSGGLVTASGTKAQKANGINDENGKAQLAEEIIKTGLGVNNRMMVDLFVQHGAEALDWLTDHGVTLIPTVNASFSVKRTHGNPTGYGAVYVETLSKEAEKLGVNIVYKATAKELVVTPDGGKVEGVLYEQGGKTLAVAAKKGVVIATGGFSSNGDMIDNAMPAYIGALSASSVLSNGSGILMATKIGAGSSHMNYGALYAYGAVTDAKKRRGVILRGHILNLNGGITVGEDAKRFVVDEASPTTVTNAMAIHGYRKCFAIATQPQLDAFLQNEKQHVLGWSKEQFLQEIKDEKLFVKKGATIEELATKLGLDPKALRKTVDTYNGYVDAGKDPEFDRKFMKGKLDKGPFYGFIGMPTALITLGGLKVNQHMNVVDVYGKPIKGLYAAGEVLGGIHGASYTGGDSLGAALALGRLAGIEVATEK